MCTGPELQQLSPPQTKPGNEENMNLLTVETEDLFSSLLELAANNDIAGFKRSIDRDANAIDEIDVWYGRQNFSNQMLLVHRTPLMVAATYGSLDVLNLILALSSADLNRTCGPDKSTALHCAASGGSIHAVDAVRLLLAAGADPTAVDARGRRPADVIVVPPKFQNMKHPLEELLLASPYSSSSFLGLASLSNSGSSSPPLSSSPDNESPSSATGSTSSPMMGKLIEIPPQSEKKEYPVDPSLPDIKNSIYATDEFRMFSFKVRPCSRAYSHDWTECPFVHPGENARRRDPRKFHYSCVPCPDFRKGACRRGDLCEYAHGVFECWLHPAQYRTRLCKDGTSCLRRVCFFAHTSEELRPLYVSTGSASPRSAASAAMEMAAAMSLLPGSPSSVSVMSPSPFASPMSPSANGLSRASSMAWPQPNVPTLHLPGSNFQSSRLRSSLNARDIPSEEFSMSHEFDALNDFSCISSQSRLSSCAGNRSFRSKTFTPSNLDELFNAEMSSSPRYSDQVGPVFSPNSNKSAILAQFQQQQQSMLSPINTNNVFSPKAIDQHSFLHSSFGISSPGRMSPCSVEPVSPMSSRMAELVQREKQQQQLRSLSFGGSNANVVGSPLSNANSWSKWGSNGKLDWGVNSEELGRFQRSSSSLEPGANGEEPDLSWVQSLVKESPPEKKEKQSSTAPAPVAGDSPSGEGNNSNSQLEAIDHSVLGAWLEQMQLDQLVA